MWTVGHPVENEKVCFQERWSRPLSFEPMNVSNYLSRNITVALKYHLKIVFLCLPCSCFLEWSPPLKPVWPLLTALCFTDVCFFGKPLWTIPHSPIYTFLLMMALCYNLTLTMYVCYLLSAAFVSAQVKELFEARAQNFTSIVLTTLSSQCAVEPKFSEKNDKMQYLKNYLISVKSNICKCKLHLFIKFRAST